MPGQTPPPVELLLGRPEFADRLAQATAFVEGRRVLVTGAAGSIGWPLSQAVAAARPDHLTLVDHHEHSLFGLERALGPAGAWLSYELLDVRDALRVRRLFERQRPEIVIHLAAAKHVPYGERFPEGALAANVLATRTLLQLADELGVEYLVYPSSDKSVQPPSVYGASKRLAEALVQQAAARGVGRRTIVRYVNIIGTRGSVIETFSLQVQSGLPLSVTDERMTRYWISMNEAIWTILQTAHCAQSGEIVSPACGEPVPVIETARRLAGWYRPDEVPYPITVTGIRPGERLHEVLLSPNESFVDGPRPGLRTVRTRRDPRTIDRLAEMLPELETLIAAGERERVASAALAAAEALQ